MTTATVTTSATRGSPPRRGRWNVRATIAWNSAEGRMVTISPITSVTSGKWTRRQNRLSGGVAGYLGCIGRLLVRRRILQRPRRLA
ncbi:MAG: hypothetical protein ACRYFW_04550 [Janthinobacterium lividum]